MWNNFLICVSGGFRTLYISEGHYSKFLQVIIYFFLPKFFTVQSCPLVCYVGTNLTYKYIRVFVWVCLPVAEHFPECIVISYTCHSRMDGRKWQKVSQKFFMPLCKPNSSSPLLHPQLLFFLTFCEIFHLFLQVLCPRPSHGLVLVAFGWMQSATYIIIRSMCYSYGLCGMH